VAVRATIAVSGALDIPVASDDGWFLAGTTKGATRMAKIQRRRFVLAGLAGAAVPATMISTPALRAAIPIGEGAPIADSVVFGGEVLTMDPKQPSAEAMADRGDRILAVGSREAIRAFVGPDTVEIDAAGKIITPGFIDAHSHPLAAQEAVGVDVNLRSIVEVQQALARQGRQVAAGGLGYRRDVRRHQVSRGSSRSPARTSMRPCPTSR
jgi:hypothetical protein